MPVSSLLRCLPLFSHPASFSHPTPPPHFPVLAFHDHIQMVKLANKRNEGCIKTTRDLIIAHKGGEGYSTLSRSVLKRMLIRREEAKKNPLDTNPGSKAPKRGRKPHPLFEADIKSRLVFEIVKDAQSKVNRAGGTEKSKCSHPPQTPPYPPSLSYLLSTLLPPP